MRKVLALLACLLAEQASVAAQVLPQFGQDPSGTSRNVYVLDPTDATWIAMGSFNTSTDTWSIPGSAVTSPLASGLTIPSPVITGSPVFPGTGYAYANGASAITYSTTVPGSALTGALSASVLGTANTWPGAQTLDSPIFVTPALGTPASGVLTNATGLPAPAVVNGQPTVSSNTFLSSLASTYAASVIRTGYAAAGDSPPVLYTPSGSACSLNSGAGDGGSQVPTSDGKCWLGKFSAPINLAVFGADPTGATSISTALAAAVAAQSGNPGCAVLIPAGSYKISTGDIFSNTCRIYGVGRDTKLLVNFASGDVFTLQGTLSEVDHLNFAAASGVTRTAGSDIKCDVIRCHIHDNYHNGQYVADTVDANGTLSVVAYEECRNATPNATAAGSGCMVEGVAGGGVNPDTVTWSHITCGHDTGIGASNSCLELKSGTAAALVDPNLLQGIDNILIDPGTGDSVLSLTIIGGFVDSAVNNDLHAVPSGGNVTRIHAVGTWFGTSGGSGVYLENAGSGTTQGFDCDSCQLDINTAQGIIVNSNKWSDITLSGGCVGGNATGVATTAGVNYVTIGGGIKIGSCDALGSGNTTGINIGGASTNWSITGVNFTGSTTPVAGDANLDVASVASGNIGYNTGPQQTISFQPGPMSSVSSTVAGFTQWKKASALDNIAASALTFTCSVNPTITLYECGTNTSCAGATTMGSVTLTTAGQVVSGSISSALIAAGDYTAWSISPGTCTSLNPSATAQSHPQ